MEKLFLVRVGSQEYLEGVARSILYKEKISPSEILLITSSAPRAVTATTLLSQYMQTPFEAYDHFLIDETHAQADTQAVEFIKFLSYSKQKPVIVLVTHNEYIYSLGCAIADFCKSLLTPSLREFAKISFKDERIQIISAA